MRKMTRSRTPSTRKASAEAAARKAAAEAAEALPKDHLPPDSPRAAPTDAPDGPPPDSASASRVAQRTPGEAGVGVRPHLEGSEQGPQ